MLRMLNGILIPAVWVVFVLAADFFPAPAADPEDDYPGEAGREVINTFVERERRREEEEALRRSLDIWAINCRRYYRGSYLSRDLKKLLRWIQNPKNKNCLPPPEFCTPLYYPHYCNPYYSNRFISRNYWRLWTKRIRERQVEGRDPLRHSFRKKKECGE
jgi:hypothetical protein